MTRDDYEPTALDFLVNELEKTGTTTGAMVKMTFPVMARIEPHLFGLIEAMTEKAGSSRNSIINQLIQVGISATIGALDEEISEELCRRGDSFVETAMVKAASEGGKA